MSLQPTEMTQQITPSHLFDAAKYDSEILQNLTHYHQLTDNQRSILYFTIEGITSDLNYTDAEIADYAGVSPRSVAYAKHNAHFLSCLSEITRQHAKSHIANVVKAIEKKAIEGSVRAQELLIRYTGDYTPTQRNENLNASIKAGQNMSTGDVISDFVSMLCNNSGWHIDKILEEIRKAYDKLKSEGNVV